MNPKEHIFAALTCDNEKRYFEAIYHFENGIAKLCKMVEAESAENKKEIFHQRIKEYSDRLEFVKNEINNFRSNLLMVNRITIAEGATGHNYNNLYGEYLRPNIKEIKIEESYLSNRFQINNLVSFLELAVVKCKDLKYIGVLTRQSDGDQHQLFENIKEDLKEKDINITFTFDNNIHDREIILSNGYVIKCGRGLDMFCTSNRKGGLGSFDFSFRKCRSCGIDILHSTYSLKN